MGVFDGLGAELLEFRAREQRAWELGPRLRTWFGEINERVGGFLPEVQIELDESLRSRGLRGEFVPSWAGLVIRVDPGLPAGQLRRTFEHEVAHLVRYDEPGLTADVHDGGFRRALAKVRGERVPSRPPAGRSAAVSRPASGRRWGPGHPNWHHHGAADCRFSCERHQVADPGLVRSLLAASGTVTR